MTKAMMKEKTTKQTTEGSTPDDAPTPFDPMHAAP